MRAAAVRSDSPASRQLGLCVVIIRRGKRSENESSGPMRQRGRDGRFSFMHLVTTPARAALHGPTAIPRRLSPAQLISAQRV